MKKNQNNILLNFLKKIFFCVYYVIFIYINNYYIMNFIYLKIKIKFNSFFFIIFQIFLFYFGIYNFIVT